MDDGSVASVFSYTEKHQSYPGRVHGGMITAMLDELGLRALWSEEGNEDSFGVTVSLETKFRKPVPYNEQLIARGKIIKNSARFFTVDSKIVDKNGRVLAGGIVNYIKLDVARIAQNSSAHEEMCYLIEDGVKEIDLNIKEIEG